MTSVTQNRIFVHVALLIPSVATLSLLTQSSAAVPATYAALAALAVTTAVVAVNSWKNGQPTRSVGQLIYEMEVVPSLNSQAPSVVDRTSAER